MTDDRAAVSNDPVTIYTAPSHGYVLAKLSNPVDRLSNPRHDYAQYLK